MKFHLHVKFAIPLLIILNIFLFSLWLKGGLLSENPTSTTTANLSNLSFDDLKKYFTNLANKKGAKYAFDQLKTTQVAPNTDMHLLGHAVGDILYKQEGLNGIKICTEDFRDACSHSIVVGLFSDKGEGALSEISDACKNAPGGKGAYTMCFHGLGHGILAYKNYDLPKAVEICKKTGTSEYGNQELSQCISGTIMEIISGGGHDRDTWGKQRKKYLFANDPFYSCAAEFMPNEAKQLCYTYITPYLWEAVGANIGSPSNEDFEKSFALCNQVPDKTYRNICFGGFGKEFVGLASSRDIRRVDQMNDDQLKEVYQWCQLAKDDLGISACLEQALSSLYWGGENNRQASIRFCNVMTDSGLKADCFTNLIIQVGSYIDDPGYKKAFCEELPNEFQSQCRSKLIS